MLIGLRETDDSIVSATFSALAVMVPILGANVVVGGERRKYFIEGRPKVQSLSAFSLKCSINEPAALWLTYPRHKLGQKSLGAQLDMICMKTGSAAIGAMRRIKEFFSFNGTGKGL